MPSLIWIYHPEDGKDRHLSFDSNGNHLQYLKGQFLTMDDKLTGDETIWKLNFTFREATLPN